jgi:hypothetical protein
VRWGAFLAQPDAAVLAPETVDEMCELQAIADPEQWTLGWGFGLALLRQNNRVFVGHAGAHLGFLAGLMVLRKEGISAAVLTNAGTRADTLGIAVELIEKTLEVEPEQPGEWRSAEAPPTEVASLLGRWWTEGSEFVLSWRSGCLDARFADDPPEKPSTTFELEGADRWRASGGRERGELLEVVRDADGIPVKLFWATYPCTRQFVTFAESRTRS